MLRICLMMLSLIRLCEKYSETVMKCELVSLSFNCPLFAECHFCHIKHISPHQRSARYLYQTIALPQYFSQVKGQYIYLCMGSITSAITPCYLVTLHISRIKFVGKELIKQTFRGNLAQTVLYQSMCVRLTRRPMFQSWPI